MKTKITIIICLFLTFIKTQAQSSWTSGTGLLYTTNTLVGIGTTTPTVGLQVKGSDYNSASLSIERTSGWGPTLFLKNLYGSTPSTRALGTIHFISSTSATTNASGASIIATSTETWSTSALGKKLEFQTASNGTSSLVTRLAIEQDGSVYSYGNTTIGTTIANKTLIINGIVKPNLLEIQNPNTATLSSGCWGTQPFIIRGTTSGGDVNIFYIGQTNNISNPYTYLQSQKNSNGSQYDLMLNPIGGAVCIGTTNNSGYRLAVNGGILCEEVKVITNVPQSDYVFEPTYNLRSLTDIETYVKKHKHLPEVPSAADFKQNGYKVGEMDDLLLRKVEELTLYIIELQKQVEVLKSVIR